MLSQGPLPRFVHGLIEYAAAVAFFVAPFVLSFHAGAAVAASIIAGVLVLVFAASTDGPTSLVNSIPLSAHVVLDYVFALLLIAVPFIAGFSSETNPTVFFISSGVVYLLVAIGTRFRQEHPEAQPEQAEQAGRSGRRRRR